MKKISLVGLLVVCTVSLMLANASDSLNNLDADGRKQGRWVIVNKMKKPPLPNFSDNQKVEEGKYQDDKKNGVWVLYFPNGNKRSEVTYENNSMNGYAKTFYETGEIMEEGDWKGNKWVGNYKLTYPNGKIQHKFAFDPQGKTDGIQEYGNEDGVIIMRGEKKKGKETGKWSYYDDKGNLTKEIMYNDDGTIASTKIIDATPVMIPDAPLVQPAAQPVVQKGNDMPNIVDLKWDGNGYQKLYNKNKLLSKDGDFERFKLRNGKEYIYDENGILQRIAVWKKSKWIGDAPLPKD